jgi:hypothetical protein
MAYTGSEAGGGRVWARYDVCKTFARSPKAALESQLEPFSPIRSRWMLVGAGGRWRRGNRLWDRGFAECGCRSLARRWGPFRARPPMRPPTREGRGRLGGTVAASRRVCRDAALRCRSIRAQHIVGRWAGVSSTPSRLQTRSTGGSGCSRLRWSGPLFSQGGT